MDVWLFLRLKVGLKGHFMSVEEIEQKATTGLTAISIQGF
jgi:hypothetical protein